MMFDHVSLKFCRSKMVSWKQKQSGRENVLEHVPFWRNRNVPSMCHFMYVQRNKCIRSGPISLELIKLFVSQCFWIGWLLVVFFLRARQHCCNDDQSKTDETSTFYWFNTFIFFLRLYTWARFSAVQSMTKNLSCSMYVLWTIYFRFLRKYIFIFEDEWIALKIVQPKCRIWFLWFFFGSVWTNSLSKRV